MKKSNIKLFLQKPNSGEIGFFTTSNKETGTVEILIKGFDAEAKRFGVTRQKSIDSKEITGLIGELSLPKNEKRDISKEAYLKIVEKTIEAIKKDVDLEKVIISRSKSVDFHPNTITEFYTNLCNAYQNAYCYLLIINQKEVWVGASPELLLKIKNKEVFTVSLAGSKSSENIAWTDKEFHEQEIVTQYIQKALGKYCKNIKIQKPITVQSASVYHLKTEFAAELLEKSTALDLIEELNPTPAVCGLPKGKAFDFIKKNEGYKRALYTGYLGVKNGEEIELFVNLRCAQLFADSLKLYLGGGITAKSNAEKEWEETEIKSKTLLNKVP